MTRLQTGTAWLDELLGGGLIPGTLTVVLGATGIGKTQLGIQFADQGRCQEGQRGILFDMSTRGDSQGHAEYARRIADWTLHATVARDRPLARDTWDASAMRRDYLHAHGQTGRRVTISDLDTEQRRQWEAEQARRLHQTIEFFYGNFVHGVRRCVIDGIEPTDRASDSIQFDAFEYVYHQILRKDYDWVARDLFRVHFRQQSQAVARHRYDHQEIGCLLLATSHEVMLDDLITRPLESGDVLSNANTIILMGKIRDGERMGRALHVAKHRGSACDDSIVPYEVTDRGLAKRS